MLRILLSAVGVGLLAGSVLPFPPRIVWNASPSVPTGLYQISSGPIRRGDLVLVRLPQPVAAMADRYGYLPRPAFLLKPVAALAGDRVCRWRLRVTVRGTFTALAASRDKHGHRLPTWNGCILLGAGDVFVLAADMRSFDGRYFGPLPRANIAGRARAIWRFR